MLYFGIYGQSFEDFVVNKEQERLEEKYSEGYEDYKKEAQMSDKDYERLKKTYKNSNSWYSIQ